MSVKISEMVTASLPLTGAEQVELVQAGNTRRATVADLAPFTPGSSFPPGITSIQAAIDYLISRDLSAFSAERIYAWRVTENATVSVSQYFASGTTSSISALSTDPLPPDGLSLLTSYQRMRARRSAVLDNVAGIIFGPTSDNDGAYREASGTTRGGGFFYRVHFGFNATKAAARWLLGIWPANGGALFGEPSTHTNVIRIAKDTGDTNWQLMHNDNAGSCTVIDTGQDPANHVDDLLELTIKCPRSGSPVSVRFLNLTDQTVIYQNDNITTNLPVANLSLGCHAHVSTGASNTAEVQIVLLDGIMRWKPLTFDY